jgi:hypothetical protein
VVRPIFVDEVGRFNAALKEHHWLGHRLTGQVLRYVAVLDGEWVAVVGFGSVVLSCRARDEFVGWSREQQYARLRHVANNQRFCVLPAGRRPNLASAVLLRVLGHLSGDYLSCLWASGARGGDVHRSRPAHRCLLCGRELHPRRVRARVLAVPQVLITITETPSGCGCTPCTATLALSCPRRFRTRC